jgi:hypothetical protein
MLLLCYESYAEDAIRELIWLSADYATVLPAGGVRFYIREDRIAFALLADPNMRRRAINDYLV